MTTGYPPVVFRAWRAEDAAAALAVYGVDHSPELERVADIAGMRALLRQWESEERPPPTGRWAIQRDGRVVGGAVVLPLPPGNEDLEIGWHPHPDVRGDDELAGEVTFALATWAFRHDIDEVFTVVRPEDGREAPAIRGNGMSWVGETRKYFDRDLRVFRLRAADLDRLAPEGQRPPA
ncbi:MULTISPECIES: GNAT family N-acetyltransferase [Actinokineospora]|uniref:N-acetyltransferase n=1 Tax=Actinokineospora fastidiosa TaxID=1816 RepID=A0A918LG74_9PSEU|nr:MULTISPECIES: GNAT family N-acetyltransferase [Actinokineospora]UVS77578.1 hypothetical protein Actkin_01293 [Actinokineospora sp. UTMC 2448]GGS42409.1 N-acetyltransferase [Actinokineospora fastidiosa]